jgi:NTP pyrophosphatase (non-canonical NTP hydrolase)
MSGVNINKKETKMNEGMTNKGLSKLIEEMGELQEVVGKKLARMDTNEHWDGKEPLDIRMTEEMADVMAAITFVAEKFELVKENLYKRADKKYKRFRYWDVGGKEIETPKGWQIGDDL